MNTNINGHTRNIIFIVFLAVTILLIVITCSAAADQDRLFADDYNLYLKATQLLNQDKYAEAEPILANLVKEHNDTYQIFWAYGLCLAENDKPAEGLDYMQKARELRPALITNQSYLVQYGEILYRMGNYSEAKRYLLESKKYKQNEDYEKKSEQLLQQINTTKK